MFLVSLAIAIAEKRSRYHELRVTILEGPS